MQSFDRIHGGVVQEAKGLINGFPEFECVTGKAMCFLA